MKKLLLLAAIAVVFGAAQSAEAQIFGGWFRTWNAGGTCQTCRGGSCATAPAAQPCEPVVEEPAQPCDAVEETEFPEYLPTPCEPCENVGACDACETCETCDACPLDGVEEEIVREIIRVRGRALRFDPVCNRRAQFNANAQANSCRLGHFSGDCNEIAGRGYTTARAALAGWLALPAHRAILLRGGYTKIGASVRRGRDGFLYWSVNFGY